MSFDLDNKHNEAPLPSDITVRVPVYRRRRGLGAAFLEAIARWSAMRELRRITHRRHRLSERDIPNYLREDIGLMPLPPAFPSWWEHRP
jgi:hypothetical protein